MGVVNTSAAAVMAVLEKNALIVVIAVDVSISSIVRLMLWLL